MSGSGGSIRIGRLVVEGRSLSPTEARRLALLLARELGRTPPPGVEGDEAPRHLDRVAAEAPADLALDRVADRVVAELRRQLA